MKWAVNMRLKTLTICLSAAEVMELYVVRKSVARVMSEEVASIWREGLGKVVDVAMRAMFPRAFEGQREVEEGAGLEVRQVAWNEVCDED